MPCILGKSCECEKQLVIVQVKEILASLPLLKLVWTTMLGLVIVSSTSDDQTLLTVVFLTLSSL